MSGDGSRGRLARWLDPPILVTDDAGRDHAFVREGGSVDVDAADVMDKDAEDEKKPATFAAWAWRWCLYVLVLGAVLGFTTLAVWLIWRLGARIGAALRMSSWVAGPLAVAIFFGWTFFGSRLRHLFPWERRGLRAEARAASIQRLRRGRCGVCDFTLDEIRTDEHGLAPCPECNARWDLPAWRSDWVEHPRPEAEWKDPQRGRGLRIFDARDASWPSLAGRTKHEAWHGLGAVRRRHWWTFDRTDARAIAVWIVGVALLGLVPLVMIQGWSANTAAVVFAGWGGILLVVLLIHRVGRTRHTANAEFVGSFVARGVCPCCEGELDPVPVKSDGALLCRRCGGAWVHERKESGN